MSEDERKDEFDAFIAELEMARRIAGPPSFKDIEVRSAELEGRIAGDLRVEMLAASTVHRNLTGGGRSLPKWRFVATLVLVLRDIARDNGVDPDRVGTLTRWKAKHEAAYTVMYGAALRQAPHDRGNQPSWLQARRIDAAGAGTTQDHSIQNGAIDLLCRFANNDQDQRQLRTLAQETMRLDWWREYHDAVPRWFSAYLSLEPAASLVRTYETHFIPSLLQTPAYAEAAIRERHPDLLVPQLKRHQALWDRRQQILYRAEPVKLWAIIDETILRGPINPEVMRAQISHLIDLCNLPNVSVQVMPAHTVDHAVAGGPITLLRFPQREFPDVICLEQLTGALYPSTRNDLHHYDKVLNRLGIEAYRPVESIEILHQILGQM